MPRFPDFRPAGVIPATLLALNEDLSIDERQTRKHLRDCALVDGVTAVTVNGHASEDGSLEAARIAAMAAREGASALLVFPPQSMTMGGHLRPEMAIEHYRRIADAADLPLIAFNYPAATGLGYPF